MRLLASALALLAAGAFHTSIRPLPAAVRAHVAARAWHSGCPVPLTGLRLLTVSYWGFDRRAHWGQLIVNADAAAPLATVFRRLYTLRFPIRHMSVLEEYGPKGS